jgi:hypothetical protein
LENVPEPSSARPKPVMPVAAIGLTPISPTTNVGPVVLIPAFARILNWPAVARLTVAGPEPGVGVGPVPAVVVAGGAVVPDVLRETESNVTAV